MTGVRPGFEEFARLAGEHSVVPVWRELLGDLETPVGAFRKLGDQDGSVLLRASSTASAGAATRSSAPTRSPP